MIANRGTLKMWQKAIAVLGLTLCTTLAANAKTTGGLVAQCQINGSPVTLQLQYEIIGGAGVTMGPGANPKITGVIGDGSSTTYWEGAFVSPNGQRLPLSGENRFLKFYDQNVYNRETVLEIFTTGDNSFYLKDVFGNYPGTTPCMITRQW